MKVWQQQIDRARGWDELLDVARAYLASLTPDEWNALPANCRPARIKGIDDLAYWHERFADEFVEVAKKGADNEGARRMLVFFTAAAERTAELCGAALSPGDDAAKDRRERRGQSRRRTD